MGTILYVLVPIPARDSHDRHCRHATVIAVGSSLFAPAFPRSVDTHPEADCGPCSGVFSVFFNCLTVLAENVPGLGAMNP
jgi:hypothetical protein